MSSQPKPPSNVTVLIFVVSLSFFCALVLSILASVLKEPQEEAKELDRSQQLLMAGKIFDPIGGYFLLPDDEGGFIPAKHVGKGLLEPGTTEDIASPDDVLTVYRKRVRPILINAEGNISSFKEAGFDESNYTADHKQSGYYKEPLMLAYELLSNDAQEADQSAEGYVIPVNGFGLWDAIYGYLAIKPDGNEVIGISWYEHAETPGLGANIAEESWQAQFPGKNIFLANPDGTTAFETAPIGINVVRGKVAEVMGESSKALSAVDGMPGATLTGNGVTKAYKEVLTAYKPFLLKLQEQSAEK